MIHRTIGDGLVILYQNAVLEFRQQTDVQIWFENSRSGDFQSFTETELRKGIERQEIFVLDATSTKTRLDYTEEQLDQPALPATVASVQILTEAQQKLVDRRADYVTRIQKLGISRGQRKFLAEAAKRIAQERNEPPETAPSPPTLNRWMRAYETSRCDVTALIPAAFSERKGRRLDEANEELIEAAIDESINQNGNQRDCQTIETYTRLVTRANMARSARSEELLEPASDSTIRRRIAEIPKFDLYVARYGREEARRMLRMSRGELPAQFPLDVAEIDHTQINWWVIDDLLMLPLGLPWITAIRDRRSRVVLGIFMVFRKAGLDSAFSAIRHSLDAHTQVQEVWPEINHPWLSNGLATTYVADRGADFLSPRFRLTLRQLGSDVQYNERKTPWHKGGIENLNKQFSQFFETLPGRTFPFKKAPPGYDPRKHAVIRFSAACYLIHKWICDIYHQTPHSRKLASPAELWAEGINQMPAPLPPSPESLDVMVGEIQTRSLSHEGIRRDWLNYANPQLERLGHRIGFGKKVQFIPQLRDMGYIHVIDPETRRPFRVDCIQQDYARGKTLFQHQYIRRRAGAGLNESNARARLAKAETELQDEIAELMTKTSTPEKVNLWQAARRAGINSSDVLNGRTRSVGDVLIPSAGSAPATPTLQQSGFTDVPSFQWGI